MLNPMGCCSAICFSNMRTFPNPRSQTLTPPQRPLSFPTRAATLSSMNRAILIACAAIALPLGPADAQDATPLIFPLDRILATAQTPYLDRDAFLAALIAITPLTISPTAAPPQNDPFVWSFTGSFGGAGAHPRPGAIFTCARYGLATRDLFAEHGFAARETFDLMNDLQPLSDDAEVWPDAAVARLHCSFIWDDAQTVAIVPEPTAQAALSAIFAEVTAHTDLPTQLFGSDGYRIHGAGGVEDSVSIAASAQVTLTQGHQQVTFRSFLRGGGV